MTGEPRNAPKSRWPVNLAKLNHSRDWVIPTVTQESQLMLLELRLMSVLLLMTTFNLHQEPETPELADELKSFTWMLGGHWELERVWTPEVANDPNSIASPTKSSMQITISDSGGLLLNYEYVVSTHDPMKADFGSATRTHFRHTDRLEMRGGRLVVYGFVVRKDSDGREEITRYNVSTSSSLSDRIQRNAEFDLMQHVSLATKIHARRVDTLANTEYRPFTPATPVAPLNDH